MEFFETRESRTYVSIPKQEEEQTITTSDLFTKHFRKGDLQSDTKAHVYCNYCRYKYAWSKRRGSYKTLKSHLESEHAEKIKVDPIQSQSTGFASNSPQLSNVFTYHHVRSSYALAEVICVDNLSLRFSEYCGFNDWMHYVQPAFEKISKQTIKINIIKVYELRKHALVDFFSRNDIYLSIGCDIWSDLQNIRSFIGITCHFIHEFSLNKRVLAFRKFDEYDKMNLCNTVQNILEEYKLTNRVFSISFDNVSSAHTASLNDLRSVCQPYFEGNFFHLKSVFHVLSLCVQDGLCVTVDLVKPIRDVCNYIWAYTSVCRVWIEFCSQNDVYPKRFSNAIGYCWSSSYNLLCQSPEYKSVLYKFAVKHVPDFSVEEEAWDRIWDRCCEIMELLNILYDAARTFCSVYEPSSHIFCLEALNIAGALNEGAKIVEIHEVMTQMRMKWLQYYKIIPEIFLVACVFDPRLKLDGLGQLLEKYYEMLGLKNDDGCDVVDMISRVRCNVDNLYSRFHVDCDFNIPCSDSSKLPVGNKYLRHLQEERSKKLRNLSSNAELDSYLTMFFEFGDDSADFDVLGWWKEHKIMFPTLAKMAFHILAVPATTVTVEQSFTEAGIVLDPRRSRLRSKLLEAQVCVNDWKRAELKAQRNVVSSSSSDEWVDEDLP